MEPFSAKKSAAALMSPKSRAREYSYTMRSQARSISIRSRGLITSVMVCSTVDTFRTVRPQGSRGTSCN